VEIFPSHDSPTILVFITKSSQKIIRLSELVAYSYQHKVRQCNTTQKATKSAVQTNQQVCMVIKVSVHRPID